MNKKFLFLPVALLAVGFFYLNDSPNLESKNRAPANGQVDLPPTEFGEIWTAKEEDIAQFIAEESIQVSKDNMEVINGKQVFHRDAHPKHHGCVKATWSPEPGIDLKQDLFTPRQADQPIQAWVRFSNGTPGGMKANDADADVRGMAIKFMNQSDTPARTLDMVLMSADRFFVRDAAQYASLMSSMGRFGPKIGGAFFMVPRWANLSAFKSAQISEPTSPFMTYTSAVPYRFGNQVVRFKAVPILDASERFSENPNSSSNYLSNVLASTLKNKIVQYKIC